MTVRIEPGVEERRVGRYLLEDLVAEHANTSLWRAEDPALQRAVGARLIPLDDPRVDQLRAAALAAAGVEDRRLVRVLDVVESGDHLAIVTEWVEGKSWSELLVEGGSAEESLTVALEVAKALESAHAAGVTHGRIRPDSVMITDTREVRLRGLGVEAAIWGIDPRGDARAADLHGIGSLVFAGTTMRWPGGESKRVDGLRAVQPVAGRLPLPSDLVADIPKAVDDICVRSMLPQVTGRPETSFSDLSEAIRALESALSSVPSVHVRDEYAAQTEMRTDRLLGRLSTIAIFVFALAGIGLLAWQLLVNVVGSSDDAQSASRGASTEVAPIPPFETPLPESAFTIAAARDFDPGGDDKENAGLAKRAIDGSKKTAWVTNDYPNANMNPKDGVGLILDMGTVRPFRAMNLLLYGSGSDFKIMASRNKTGKLSDFKEVVEISAAGGKIKVRTPKAVKARYVLVWFTGLPYDGANYVGGLRDVKIVG